MKQKRKCKGQSMVETAITLPIVLLILFFMIYIGIYIYDNIVVIFAAEKALDSGIGLLYRQDLSTEQRENLIKNNIDNYLNISLFLTEPDEDLPQEVLDVEGDNPDERMLTVVARRRFEFALPLIGEFLEDKLVIKHQCTYVYKTSE